jgi:hypothetical protein
MNYSVSIPPDFFLTEAKQEYTDIRGRLVQELLQNSLDAGATEIMLSFAPNSYSCHDNGKGMARDRMVSAMLTMGGSVKDSGNTGGFGAAKKLLLFAHKSFEIHSNETGVAGAGLSYNFIPSLIRNRGTMVRAEYADVNAFWNMQGKAVEILSRCNFRDRVKIWINDVKFTDYASAKHVKAVDGLGNLYANKAKTDDCYVQVMHNGLFMFDRYVPELNRKVMFDVVGKSVDIFTQNRDGFRGAARNRFDELVTELTIDKKSICRPKQRRFVARGLTTFINHVTKQFDVSPYVKAQIARMFDTGSFASPGVAEMAVRQLANDPKVSPAEVQKVIEVVKYVQVRPELLEADFHFDLADSSYRKVPDKFIPNAGKKKYTDLAKLWKTAVREVLKANGLDQQFTIGFTFSSEASATHERVDGVSRYLVNPLSAEIDKGTKQERVMSILTIACHEVVHSQGRQYHDESFVRKFHDLLVPTLTKGPTWRQLLKLSAAECV